MMAYGMLGCQSRADRDEFSIAMHEAAHAVVAMRLGLPVRYVSIEQYQSEEGDCLDGRTCCEWEALHDTIDNRTLCTRAFASAYAGAWLDAIVSGTSFTDSLNKLPSDGRAVKRVQERLMSWEGVTFPDTKEVSLDGAELARTTVQQEMSSIERFAKMLVTKRSLNEEELKAWFVQDVAQQG